MKRSPMSPRKTPLQSRSSLQPGTGLSRRAPLPVVKHTAGPPEVKFRAPRRRRPQWPPGLRDQVFAAAGGCCDICGQQLSPKRWECHHRRLRSQGGRDERANLLALHHACHDHAHRNRRWAKECGYIVHRGDEPGERPVWRHGHSWQLPTADGWAACLPNASVPGPVGPNPPIERSAA